MWSPPFCCSVEFCASKVQTVDAKSASKDAPKNPQGASLAAQKANAADNGGGADATNGSPPTGSLTKSAVKELDSTQGGSRPSKNLDSCDAASVTSGKSSRSAFSAASSIGSEFINDNLPDFQKRVAKIQAQMKCFVKGMVKGREMNVLSVDGQLRHCCCSFDRKLRKFNIIVQKETRTINISDISEVLQGIEPKDIATPLDDWCTTLVLKNGECLSFRFNEIKEREEFAMCLQIIVDGSGS